MALSDVLSSSTLDPDGAPAEPDGAPGRPRRAARAGVRQRIGWLLAELLVVFVGVYSAFWLEGWREDRAEARRERQIYAALHRDLAESAPGLRRFSALIDSADRAWTGALERGEMPDVTPIAVSVDASTGTWDAILQAGGLELLDVELVRQMESMYANGRFLREAAERGTTLSGQYIWPRLAEGDAAFYDTATGRLRPEYGWYPALRREIAQRTVRLSRTVDSMAVQVEARMER
jgi:hypothetical protein